MTKTECRQYVEAVIDGMDRETPQEVVTSRMHAMYETLENNGYGLVAVSILVQAVIFDRFNKRIRRILNEKTE